MPCHLLVVKEVVQAEDVILVHVTAGVDVLEQLDLVEALVEIVLAITALHDLDAHRLVLLHVLRTHPEPGGVSALPLGWRWGRAGGTTRLSR